MLSKIILFLLVILQAEAFSCELEIVSVQSMTFNWSLSGQTLQRDIVVERSGPNLNSCRRFHLTFTNGNAGNINRLLTNNSATLSYNVFSDAGLTNILRDHPNVTNQGHVINSSFSGNQTQKTVSFYQRYPPPPYLSTVLSGIFSDNLQLKLYRGRWNNVSELDDSRSANPTVNVPTYTAISLIESGSPFNSSDTFQLLDFGTLESNESMGFDIAIESNISYNLNMSSTNNGVMKHLSNPDTIAYTIQIGPNTYSLVGSQGNPLTVANHNGTTSQGGFRHQVSVEVGNVNNKTAGTYQDTITIEAIAQ
jgi:spore coat protein U-like protein